MSSNWWERSAEGGLRQGQLLQDVDFYRVVEAEIGDGESGEIATIEVTRGDGIVLTQSCDLETKGASLVTLCRVFTASEFAAENAGYNFGGETVSNSVRSKWEELRAGKLINAHLLQSPFADAVLDPWRVLVVDFRQLLTVPRDAADKRLTDTSPRLLSPYLEHFSQAFARSFMRVGLPSDLPSFKRK